MAPASPPRIAELLAWLAQMSPRSLAEDWDNVGLLLGDSERLALRVLTCLTLTSDVVQEAVTENAQLVITHHPFPFKPLARLVSTDSVGGRLLALAEAKIAVASFHTAFDSATAGINAQWATAMGLAVVKPLRTLTPDSKELPEEDAVGAGRCGNLASPLPMRKLVELARTISSANWVEYSGDPDRSIERVGVACGSGGEFLPAAVAAGCQVLITGEARFHTVLEAQAANLGLILVGHYQSERFAMDWLADQVSQAFPQVKAWGSRVENDPRRLLTG